MMDGSLGPDMKTPMSYEYNVDVTSKTVAMAHACGVSVEGELGCLGSLETGMAGEEDGSGAEGVLSHDQLLTDPQVQARNMVQQIEYPGLGKIPIAGIPMKMSLTPASIRSHAPQLGEHNDYVYYELLGLSPDKVSSLKEEGII